MLMLCLKGIMLFKVAWADFWVIKITTQESAHSTLCSIKKTLLTKRSVNQFKWVKDTSTPDFSNPSCNPRLFNYELLNPRLFNHEFLNHGVEKFIFEKSEVEKFEVKKSGVGKSGVRSSRVEMSFNLLERWHFNPRLFDHELFNPMHGSKIHGWKI